MAISEEDTLALLAEIIQCVSRLAAQLLDNLVSKDDVSVDFFESCIKIWDDLDDQGHIRRLVKAIYAIDPVMAVRASKHIDFSEIGIRRKVGMLLLGNKDLIIEKGSSCDIIDVINLCSESAKEAVWIGKYRELRGKLNEGIKDGF